MSELTTLAGYHLMIDGKSTDKRISNVRIIHEVLADLPDWLGMTKVLPPMVRHFKSTGDIAGVVVIAESHISIHAFPSRNTICIDVFSCKPFDVKAVEEIFIKEFTITETKSYFKNRGKHFSFQELQLVKELEEEHQETIQRIENEV